MDTINADRQIVQQVISHYGQLRPSHGQIRLETVFDEKQDRYALMQVGWDRGRRVRGNLIYLKCQKRTPAIADRFSGEMNFDQYRKLSEANPTSLDIVV